MATTFNQGDIVQNTVTNAIDRVVDSDALTNMVRTANSQQWQPAANFVLAPPTTLNQNDFNDPAL